MTYSDRIGRCLQGILGVLFFLAWPFVSEAEELEVLAGGHVEAQMPLLLADNVVPAPAPPEPQPASQSNPDPSNDQNNSGLEHCVRRDDAGRFMGWMDYQHCTFSDHTIATARWVDDIFGDWYDDRATMLLHVINEVTEVEGEGMEARFRVRVSAALPNAKRRLRLIVTDDADQDDRTGNQDVLNQVNQARRSLSAALRWITLDRDTLKSDVDIGVRGASPPDLFLRWRIRDDWSLTQNSVARVGQTFRYGSDSKGRSTSQLDLERALSENSVARLSSAIEYLQLNHENGFNWGQSASLSHALGRNKALSYGFTVNGYTQPDWHKDNYGPWLIFRSSFLRDWLFYEVEPRVTYYHDQNWRAVNSLTLRLELQFGKK